MTEILICNTSTPADLLHSQCGIHSDNIFCTNETTPTMLNRFTPYAVGNQPSSNDKDVMTFLSPFYISKSINELSSVYGEDNTLALSNIFSTLSDNGVGSALLGSSSGVYTKRVGMFTDSVTNYQKALLNYRDASKGGISSKTLAKQHVKNAFQSMQQRFQFELMSEKVRGGASRRGTVFSNMNRGLNIAQSSRSTTKLNLSGQIETFKLAQFSKHAKLLGNGVIAFDFYNRANLVKNSYDNGGDWERDFFVETLSFATSTWAGIAAANTLSLIVFATPVGWVRLIVGGLAVIGTSVYLAITTNNVSKNLANRIYDSAIDLF